MGKNSFCHGSFFLIYYRSDKEEKYEPDDILVNRFNTFIDY